MRLESMPHLASIHRWAEVRGTPRCPSELERYDLLRVDITSQEGHLVDATFSHPAGGVRVVRRPESGVRRGPGAADGAGPRSGAARAGRRADERADRQGCP